MEIIIFIIVVSLLFPGSSGPYYGPDIGEVLGFIACALFLIGLVFAWTYSVVGLSILFDWLGWRHPVFAIIGLLGPIAAPMLAAGIANGIINRRKRQVTL